MVVWKSNKKSIELAAVALIAHIQIFYFLSSMNASEAFLFQFPPTLNLANDERMGKFALLFLTLSHEHFPLNES